MNDVKENQTLRTLRFSKVAHGRPQGGGKGRALAPPPWNLKKMTPYAAVLPNTLKLLLAPSALALDTLYFSLKRREKNAKILVCAFGAPKMFDFLYGAPKACQLFKVSVILPPLKKFLRATMRLHLPSQQNAV